MCCSGFSTGLPTRASPSSSIISCHSETHPTASTWSSHGISAPTESRVRCTTSLRLYPRMPSYGHCRENCITFSHKMLIHRWSSRSIRFRYFFAPACGCANAIAETSEAALAIQSPSGGSLPIEQFPPTDSTGGQVNLMAELQRLNTKVHCINL